MTWALKRQILYILALVSFLSLVIFYFYRSYTYEIATCTDRLKNGIETGIDCGGDCPIACTFEADPVSVMWARSFPVVTGRYNAVAYLENKNQDLVLDKIRYSFRFADKDNVYLGRREGSTFVPPGRKFAVFERGIELNSSVPVYTTFEFTEVPVWITVPETKINQLQLFISEINLTNEAVSPFLSANLKNNSLFGIPDINVVAILYDENNNAVSASSTYIDELRGEETQTLSFTWPEPFATKVVTKEILPAYNILGVKIK